MTEERTETVDHRTPTGTYRIVARKGYGNRKYDRPAWWPFAYHAFRALVQLLGVIALAYVAKRCGLVVPP